MKNQAARYPLLVCLISYCAGLQAGEKPAMAKPEGKPTEAQEHRAAPVPAVRKIEDQLSIEKAKVVEEKAPPAKAIGSPDGPTESAPPAVDRPPTRN